MPTEKELRKEFWRKQAKYDSPEYKFGVCQNCGAVGRTHYGGRYCDAPGCRDEYDRKDIVAFHKASCGKNFMTFRSSELQDKREEEK